MSVRRRDSRSLKGRKVGEKKHWENRKEGRGSKDALETSDYVFFQRDRQKRKNNIYL